MLPSQDDIDTQLKLLRINHQTLAHYLMRRDTLGSVNTPPEISHGIRESRENIQRIKTILYNWGVTVLTLPTDEEPNVPSYQVSLCKDSNSQAPRPLSWQYISNKYRSEKVFFWRGVVFKRDNSWNAHLLSYTNKFIASNVFDTFMEARVWCEAQLSEMARPLNTERQRVEAERQAERQRLEAERQAKQQRVEAERQAEQQRVEAERQAKQQRVEAEQERIRNILDKLINLAQLPNTDELTHKINFGLSSIPSSSQEKFWSRISSKIVYGDPLYEIAPLDIRMSIVRDKFNDFLNCLEKCVRVPDFQIRWQPEIVYSRLEAQDKKLAQEWLTGQSSLSKEQRPYVEAKMLSARAAELVAYSFFDALEQCPEDISITQLRHGSEEWKSYDLLLKGDIKIDVKNSRTARNQRAYYVEHCVPRFKYTSERKDIWIAGVLSPYIRLDEFENSQLTQFHVEPITFLGITSRFIIQRLEERFRSDQLQTIRLEKKSARSERMTADHIDFHVIPPWIFDYPNKFYEGQRIFRERLTHITYYPSWDEIRELGINPLPAIIATGSPIPLAWQKFLPPWQIDFCANMIRFKTGRLSLPQLYLNILSHFLKMLSLGKNNRRANDYQPRMYTALLYVNFTSTKTPTTFYGEDEMAQKTQRDCSPLGIVDPLNIIKNLITSLQIVWEYMVSNGRDLRAFQSFSFKGLGLLTGKPKDSRHAEQTILAYCGGKVGGMSCGNTPLVIGKHKTCPTCGHLVCDACGFCSENCKNPR